MRYVGAALLVAAMVFAFAPAAQAVVTPTDAPAAVRVAGQLTKIDGKALTITPTTDGLAFATVITCNDATKFSRDPDSPADAHNTHRQATFQDLKVGQNVRAYYTAADNVAVNVIIVAAPAPGHAK